MRIRRIDVAHIRLRLRTPFRHALFLRTDTDNLLVRVLLEDGTVGWGEGVPRDYVTGETADAGYESLRATLAPALLGAHWRTYEALLDDLSGRALGGEAAARAALELALLDAGGLHFRRSVLDLLGGARATVVRYGVGLSADNLAAFRRKLRLFRLLGVRRVKIKLGVDESDVERVATARQILGPKAIIGVDVNGAWSPEVAIRTLHRLAAYQVSFVEEPTAPGDLDGLRAVAAASPMAVVVDESLRTLDDARRLVEHRACHRFNIRISKCGGITRCLELARFAEQHGLGYHIGCQVGESGVLSAAGRHLILHLGRAAWAEGSYGTWLLEEDVTRPEIRAGRALLGRPLAGAGLGVHVDEARLERHLVREDRLA